MRGLMAILRHRGATAAVFAAAAVAFLPGIARLGWDDSAEVFFVRDAAAHAGYERLKQEFGDDFVLRLVVRGPGLATTGGLAWLGRLEETAASLPGVDAVGGLYGRFEPEMWDWPPPDAAAFLERAREDLLSRSAGWIAGDARTVTVLIALRSASPAAEARTLADLEGLARQAPSGLAAELVGLPLLSRALDQGLRRDVGRLLPLLLLLAASLLGAALRRASAVVAPLLFGILILAPVFGALGALGTRLNLVTAVLPPLLTVVALATSVHVLTRFRDLRASGLDPGSAVVATYREKSWPLLAAGTTTLVAFGSLAQSAVPPVRSLGVVSALAMALTTFAAFTLYPALLALLPTSTRPPRPSRFETWARRSGRRAADFAVERRPAVLVPALLLALVAAAGLPRLKVAPNPLSYLAPDHPARAAFERLDHDGIAGTAAQLILDRRDAGGGFRDPSSLRRLASLAAEIRRTEPAVRGAVSAGDLLAAAEASWISGGAVDDDLRWLVLGLVEGDPRGRRSLAALLTADGAVTRLVVFLRAIDGEQMAALEARLLTRCRTAFPRARASFTGRYPLVLAAQRNVLRTMIRSLGLTLSAVVLAFVLLLRRIRQVLAALVPNLWPVLLTLGALGWGRVALDGSTVMIPAVVLGLAVDDTLHTLGLYRRLAPAAGPTRAAIDAVESLAPAHLLTSAILAAGLATCGVAGVVPVARFGTFAATGILAALAGDLLLLPPLLAGPRAAEGLPEKTSTSTRGRGSVERRGARLSGR